ncbi:MAG: hypothetical protein QXO84_02290 [Candidatus Aenigmatarchaeota archaeon]
MDLKVFCNGGIGIKIDGKNIFLDSVNENSDLVFISHAHLDHIKNVDSVLPKISSSATRDLIRYRTNSEMINYITFDYFNIGNLIVKQLNSGHIVGSTSLLIEYKNKKIFYSGDICDKHRFNLKGADVPKSDIMILEATFGREDYQFPPISEIIENSIKWIREQVENKFSVALLGYPVGKAQIISKIVEAFDLPIIIYDEIFDINEICKNYGFQTKSYIPFSKATDITKNQQFISIFPNSIKYVNFLRSLKFKNPIKIAAFSGWAIKESYKQQRGLDEAFPLSDHADFNGLLKIMKQSDPEIVYTFHGFKEDLSNAVKEKLGIDSIPLC